MQRWAGLLVVLAWAAGATAAAPDELRRSSDKHFRVASTEFDQGHYLEAAREFEQAYQIQQQYRTDDHSLLFNIAQAWRLGGDCGRAVKSFRAYLGRVPGSPERKSIEHLIGKCEKAQQAQHEARTERPTGTLRPGETRLARQDAVRQEGVRQEGVDPNGGPGSGGHTVLILASEQVGAAQLRGWSDLVWGPQGGGRTSTVVRTVNELGGLEATLAEELTSAGYEVIEPSVLRGRLVPRAAVEAVDLSPADGRNIALRTDAELVLLVKGSARAMSNAQLGQMLSGQANVAARLVRVDNGQVVAATTQHAAQVHIDGDTACNNALVEAGRLTARTLIQKLAN